MPGFVAVPRDDPAALRRRSAERTAAVLIEPIQGETRHLADLGRRCCAAAREACDRSGALLIFDEIQCGMGRTGTLWAFEQTPVGPDVLTVAKSLASGLPIGACVAAGEAAEALEPGDHGSTFGGGPVVAAAALATLDVIDDERMLALVRRLGERLHAGLEGLRGEGKLTAVRGRGLMLAGDLPERAGGGCRAGGAGARIVLNSTGPATLRFLPPFVIERGRRRPRARVPGARRCERGRRGAARRRGDRLLRGRGRTRSGACCCSTRAGSTPR